MSIMILTRNRWKNITNYAKINWNRKKR